MYKYNYMQLHKHKEGGPLSLSLVGDPAIEILGHIDVMQQYFTIQVAYVEIYTSKNTVITIFAV